MEKLSAWRAKGKIRVFFSPPPANSAINSIAEKLNIDCSKLDNKQKKEIFNTITGLFEKNLEAIYNQTIQTSRWEGSDIWRFFKNDVKDYCIERDTNYRNILIILTDGYIYHRQSQHKNGNKYSYLQSSNLRRYVSSANFRQQIDREKFGLITERADLNKLEILVLEVNADKNKIEEDILKYVIEKWFTEMNVLRYGVYNSDLPANTKTRIENFLNYE
jgi:hypothetical protein